MTPLRRWPPRPPRLFIGALNIQDSRGFGLVQAICVVESGGFDVMLITKTNISTMAYFQDRLGYKITCSSARPSSAGGAQGGVGLVTRERPDGWGIESML